MNSKSPNALENDKVPFKRPLSSTNPPAFLIRAYSLHGRWSFVNSIVSSSLIKRHRESPKLATYNIFSTINATTAVDPTNVSWIVWLNYFEQHYFLSYRPAKKMYHEVLERNPSYEKWVMRSAHSRNCQLKSLKSQNLHDHQIQQKEKYFLVHLLSLNEHPPFGVSIL